MRPNLVIKKYKNLNPCSLQHYIHCAVVAVLY